MKKMDTGTIAYLIEILGSLLLGGLALLDTTWTAILVIAGVIVGFSIKPAEAKTFLLYAIVLLVVSLPIGFLGNIGGFIEGALQGLGLVMGTIAVTIVIKALINKTKLL